jgi:imidazolonepropionase-like amidohydrolase
MRSYQRPQGEYWLEAARLLDVTEGKLLQNHWLRVQQNIITEITQAKPTGNIVSLGDTTLLPGLHDNHCHLMFNPGNLDDAVYKRSSAKKTLDALQNAQTTLWAGFTTVRDPGDCDWQYGLIDLRGFIEKGHAAGPRIIVAPHYLSITGGHGDANNYACDLCMRGVGKIVDGVDEMRKAVREEIKFGADWIKLFASGGVLSMGDDPRHSHYSREELAVAAEEAHRHGKKITAHAHGAEAVRYCAELGFDSVEHCTFIDDEGIQIMKAKGVYCVPTLYVLDYLQGPESLAVHDASIIAKAKRAQESQRARFTKIAQEGVKIAYGTDIGIFPHGENWRDFRCMLECKMSPLEAIRSATINSAQMNGILAQVGALQVGLEADIIGAPGNPLEDLDTLAQIRFVMKGGAIFRDDR